MTDEPRPDQDGPDTPLAGDRPDFMGPELQVADDRAGPSRRQALRRLLPLGAALLVGIGLGVGGTLLFTGAETGTAAAGDAAAAPQVESGEAPTLTLPPTGRDDPDAFGEVAVSGTSLPRLAGDGDPMAGATAPEVRGFDFAGNPVEITADGRAKIVVFLAHWCPYCQQELPIVRDWYATAAIPDGVDVYSVATLTDVARSNYPPRTWLETQDWNLPVLVDDDLDSAAEAFGLNAVPFWVLINSDGTIAVRGAGGGIPAEALDNFAARLAAGPDGEPQGEQ